MSPIPFDYESADLLIFDDLQQALQVYNDLDLSGDEPVWLGVRLHSGAVVPVASPTTVALESWERNAEVVPKGGGALLAAPSVIDRAIRLAGRASVRRAGVTELIAFRTSSDHTDG